MKRIIAFTLTVIIISLSFAGCVGKKLPKEMPEDFSFSITWGTFGISSYDSKTGRLVKTKDATVPDDYVTTYILTDDELKNIYNMIRDMEIEDYGEFGAIDFGASDPYLTLSLTVEADGFYKTVTADEVSGYNDGNTPRAKRYLEVIRYIRDILINTDEWKALPDYEFYYD